MSSEGSSLLITDLVGGVDVKDEARVPSQLLRLEPEWLGLQDCGCEIGSCRSSYLIHQSSHIASRNLLTRTLHVLRWDESQSTQVCEGGKSAM